MTDEYSCPVPPPWPWTMSKFFTKSESRGKLLVSPEEFQTHVFRHWTPEDLHDVWDALTNNRPYKIMLYDMATGVTQETKFKLKYIESLSHSVYVLPWDIAGADYRIGDTIFLRWESRTNHLRYYVCQDSPQRNLTPEQLAAARNLIYSD